MKSSTRINRTSVQPVKFPRSNRVHTARSLTSLPAGKMVPITAIPLLREDAISSGKLRFSVEMMETAEILMNAVYVHFCAYLVPTLAFDRFSGMDELNRAYEGIPNQEGGAVTPYIESQAFGAYGANDVYVYLGLHAKPTDLVNTGYLEAYNQIWNYRAKNRSPDIALRTRLQANLAPAFWRHEMFRHIVPDFDQALIDGEVPLNVVNGQLPVKGIGMGTPAVGVVGATIKETGDSSETWSHRFVVPTENMHVRASGAGAAALPMIFAELAENGITVSLSNIDMARKTAAFARLRQQYHGHSDDYLINMLMDGITVPEQSLRQPLLVGEQTTLFGMSKRYASDAGNLTESVVNGATQIDMSIQLPRIPTGGVLMIMCEITPEQLFERQKDAYLHTTSVPELPAALRDTLDPEKVAAVPCDYVDIDHDTPTATFGYAPLNYQWNVTAPRIGGKFYRPLVDAPTDEARQRLWAVETQNPTLSEDFYLCTSMHTKPFVVTNADPFEIVVQGDFIINGNTVFGQALMEASDDWEKVLAKAPQGRLDKDGTSEGPFGGEASVVVPEEEILVEDGGDPEA